MTTATDYPDDRFDHLTTERLIIRRFTQADAETFAAYRSNQAVARYQSWDAPISLEQAREFIDYLQGNHPDTPGDWFQFAIAEKRAQAHIGDLALLSDADDPRLATVGFTLSPSAQGRGYGTEALSALLDYLFLQRHKHRVRADCDTRNIASARLLERVGMRREAHHVRSSFFKGEWADEYVYAVLADEWQVRPRPLVQE